MKILSSYKEPYDSVLIDYENDVFWKREHAEHFLERKNSSEKESEWIENVHQLLRILICGLRTEL